MNAWKVILATLVIFGAGIVTGALFFGHGQSIVPINQSAVASIPTNTPPPAIPNIQPHATGHLISPPGPLMPMLRKGYLQNLEQELQLTDDQRKHIEKILSDGQDHTKSLWDQIAPQIKQECCDAKRKIQAELTPSQKERFDAMMKNQKKPDEAKAKTAMATNSVPTP